MPAARSRAQATGGGVEGRLSIGFRHDVGDRVGGLEALPRERTQIDVGDPERLQAAVAATASAAPRAGRGVVALPRRRPATRARANRRRQRGGPLSICGGWLPAAEAGLGA